MNFFNKALYNLVLSPKALYNKLGIQTDKLALILQVKLMMDDRRPNTFNQQQKRNKPQKELSKATLWGILGSAFMGLFFTYAFAISEERLLQLTVYFGMYIVLLAMVLITEVSNLLLDSKDNTIILPAPVNSRTLLLGRLLHIIVIIMRSGLPMMLAGWVVTSIIDGWRAALIFPWVCVLAILFTVFLVNGFYLIILRLVSVQRFKNIVASMQIMLSIIVFASYQLLPRLLGNGALDNLQFQTVSWSIYFPTQWFASLYEIIVHGVSAKLVVIGAAASVLGPVVAFFVLIKYLAPAFNKKIGALAGGESEKPLTTEQKAQRKKGRSLANILSEKLTGNYTEQAAFRLAWNISSRSRDFKMKVYPSIGYQVVYLAIFFVGSGRQKLSLQSFSNMEGQAFFLMMSLIYLSSFSINTIVTQMLMSEKPKAAWVFFTAPLTEPGQVISGAFKAMLVKFLVPAIVIISAVTLALSQGKMAIHLLVGFANVLMSCSLFGYFHLRKFPFSTPMQGNARTGNILLGIIVSFLPFGIGVVHALLKKNTTVLIILVAFSFAITYFLFQQMQKREWQSILSKYSDD